MILTLETERLLFRQCHTDDIDDFHQLMHNPACIMGGWKPSSNKQESLEILKSYIEAGDRIAIILKDNNKVIGLIRVYPDNNRGKYKAKMINYLLNSNCWSNGYITEAVKYIVQYTFNEFNIDLLTAFTTPQNIGSIRVLEKSGFEYEGTIENGFKRYDGAEFDSVIYSIFKSDYNAK